MIKFIFLVIIALSVFWSYNNLKMSGKDEVLIIVKEDEEQPQKNKKIHEKERRV